MITQKQLRANPLEKACSLSKVLFWWMNGFFREGNKCDIKEEDMYRLIETDTSYEITKKFEKNWKKELKNAKQKNSRPSLARATIKTYFFTWFCYSIFAIMEETSKVASAILLRGLLQYFQNEDSENIQVAYLYAFGILACSAFNGVVHHIYFYKISRLGWHLRVSISSLMYKKVLKLSQRSLVNTTTGKVINLSATDVIRFDFVTLFLHYLFVGPAMTCVIAYLLYQELGPSSWVGLTVIAVLMLGQSLIGRYFGKLRSKIAVITDERIRIMNEVISAVRIIKMYTWEKSFQKLVSGIRRREAAKIVASSILKASNFSLVGISSRILPFVTFLTYVLLGGRLTPSLVFTSLAFYNSLRVPITIYFPLAWEKLFETRISLGRIQELLMMEEKVGFDETNNDDEKSKNSKKSFVEFQNFSATWSKEEKMQRTLSDINVKVDKGMLLAVIGPVGCGKSSFISSILRELTPEQGHLRIAGHMTYAGQSPWVFSDSIKENILFGLEYDYEKYSKVVAACALERDIASFEHGDETLVGEKGVTLSGGQKARVNLARAAYRDDCDIVLLDDPLSAVDPSVANSLFNNCICGYMKNHIRILVTHQLQFLKCADQILILKEGRMAGLGTYEELQADGTDFAALLKKNTEKDEIVCEVSKSPIMSQTSIYEEELISQMFPGRSKSDVSNLIDQEENESHTFERTQSLTDKPEEDSKGKRVRYFSQNNSNDNLMPLIKPKELPEEKTEYTAQHKVEELKQMGSIKFHVYFEYFLYNIPVAIVVTFLSLASHVLYVLTDWWISLWSVQSEIFYSQLSTLNLSTNVTVSPINTVSMPTATSTSSAVEQFDDRYYMVIYGIITGVCVVVLYVRCVVQYIYLVRSGIKMHNKMFNSIMHSPLRFFDTNPVGRILNRFSKDMGQIDEVFPQTFMDFSFIFLLILSSIILSLIVNYFVIFLVIPLLIYFIWLRQYYIKTSRDIKRIEGSSRSPVFSHLSNTIEGLTTVRALKMQNVFEERYHQYQDLHSSAWFLFLNGSRWLAIRLDLIVTVFIAAVVFFSVLTVSVTDIDAGQVGLTITYATMLTGMFQWGVRQSTEVENLMTSVERIQEYYKIKPEAPHEIEDKTPPKDWPQYGIITFDNLSYAHYQGGPLVLNNIRINIRAQEKVGIVGRTGAGKSSLISTLFRFNEYSGGEIYIDGVKTSELGLTDLRSVISIIPQDPILFAGTMRKNLDIFSVHTDDELWSALEQVQLKPAIEKLPLKLQTVLSEAGSNFSVGQRQLICLARAILRKNKFLVIDEATANVDVRTDRLIQQTIRINFKHCTVLTIAHRINTIIDSDRVLVLDNGKVVEFENPHVLLEDKHSAFSDMLTSMGKSEVQHLKELAKMAYELHNSEEHFSEIKDSDRSFLQSHLPTPGTYDHLELESNV